MMDESNKIWRIQKRMRNERKKRKKEREDE